MKAETAVRVQEAVRRKEAVRRGEMYRIQQAEEELKIAEALAR